MYERWLALRWAVGGAAMTLGVAGVEVGAFLAGVYLAADLSSVWRVVAGAAASLVLGRLVAAPLWRRRPLLSVIERRIASYESDPVEFDMFGRIRAEDFDLVVALLRRHKLHVVGGANGGTAPQDAPELTMRLVVERPGAWPSAAGRTLDEDLIAILGEAGIRARIAGQDVNPATTPAPSPVRS
jgi:hypothetical protein